jgi:Flp pilus assembly pilin Flp
MKTNQLKNAFRSFHDDEAGLEALQVVMILAVAAVALIAVKTQWSTVKGWYDQVMGDATSGWDA